jgi:hypothetical protein
MENPCQPSEMLYSSQYGTVYQCRQCAHLQIEFGNLIIGYTPEAFRLFSGLISHIDLEDEDLYHAHLHRPIVVQPVCSTGYYCFSRQEIRDLRELLTGALTMLDLDHYLTQHQFKNRTA